METLAIFWTVFVCGMAAGAGTVMFISKRYRWTVFVSNNEAEEKKVIATIHQLNRSEGVPSGQSAIRHSI